MRRLLNCSVGKHHTNVKSKMPIMLAIDPTKTSSDHIASGGETT